MTLKLKYTTLAIGIIIVGLQLNPVPALNAQTDNSSSDKAAENPKSKTHPHVHSHEEQSLHFSHPLITENPSPDTKLRFDYFVRDIDEDAQQATTQTFQFGGEYAFHRSFSFELTAPYTINNPEDGSTERNLDNTEVNFKFANFAFAEQNVLLGYGLEMGLPTGDDAEGIGSNNELEFEPYLNIGYKWRRLEVIAWSAFGIATNQDDGEDVETELAPNLSFLYHVTPRVSGLLEFDGETVLSGDEDGNTVINVTPGVKFKPFKESDLKIGVGISLPLTGREEFELRGVASAFYHF